jgi:hypothetical protein
MKKWGFIWLLFWVLPVLAQQDMVLLPPANGVYVADAATVQVHSPGSVYVHATLYIAKPARQRKKVQTAVQPPLQDLAALQTMECTAPAANNTNWRRLAGHKPRPAPKAYPNAQVPALPTATVSVQQAPPIHGHFPNYPGQQGTKFPADAIAAAAGTGCTTSSFKWLKPFAPAPTGIAQLELRAYSAAAPAGRLPYHIYPATTAFSIPNSLARPPTMAVA